MNFKYDLKKYNKYKLLSCMLGCFLLTSNVSIAADWTSIKKTKDYELQVDMDSYNETDGLPFITAKQTFYKSQNLVKANNKIVFIKELTTNQFDCKAQLHKKLDSNFFNNQGALVDSIKPDDLFKPIKKHSDVATIASLVCQVYKMLGGG